MMNVTIGGEEPWLLLPIDAAFAREGSSGEKVNKRAGAVQYAGGAERGAAVPGRNCSAGGICLPDAGLCGAAAGS